MRLKSIDNNSVTALPIVNSQGSVTDRLSKNATVKISSPRSVAIDKQLDLLNE